MNLENFNLVGLSAQEKKEIEGGILGFMLVVAIGLLIGFFVARLGGN